MMKFDKVLEDGQFEIFRSTNHADKNRAGEIIHDWDTGTWAAIIVDPVDDGQIKNLGEFETCEIAVRHLECEVTHRLVVGPDALTPQRARDRKNDVSGLTESERRRLAFMF